MAVGQYQGITVSSVQRVQLHQSSLQVGLTSVFREIIKFHDSTRKQIHCDARYCQCGDLPLNNTILLKLFERLDTSECRVPIAPIQALLLRVIIAEGERCSSTITLPVGCSNS